MLCQRLRSCRPNICSQRGHVYCFYHVHFLHCLFRFTLFCFLSLSLCSLFVWFSLIVWVSVFFLFISIYLEQSTCIMFTSRIVGFALSCCLLFSSCFLIDHFPRSCLGFWFFCFFKKQLQQSTWSDSTKCTIQNMTNYTRNMFQLHVSTIQ
jgi:hypothetical protein